MEDAIEISKKSYYVIYTLFYALGVITILPSNFFTTANDYWMYKFRDVNNTESYNNGNNKTGMQAEFTSDYSVVSNVAYVAFIVVSIRYLRPLMNLFYRTLMCLSGAILCFIITCIFVYIDTDTWQTAFFVITMIIGFFLTGFSGAFMVTLFEAAIKFPRSFVPTIFSGQSICGILAALVQILALAIGGGPRNTGLIYFLMGMMFVVIVLVAFLLTWKTNEQFKFYFLKKPEARENRPKLNKDIVLQLLKSALNKAKFYIVAMVIALGSTIMLHPGVINLVESMDKGNGNQWNDVYFGPVVNFLFFYLFDYMGRECATLIKKPTNGKFVLGFSIVRIAFVPLIMFCNAQPRSSPVVFDDAAYIIFLILLAFTNGYLVNLSIVLVPEVTDDRERPFAMLAVMLLIVISIAVCAGTSTALVKAL